MNFLSPQTLPGDLVPGSSSSQGGPGDRRDRDSETVTILEGKFKFTRASTVKPEFRGVCVFITQAAVPITKLFAWGEGDSGGHVLRETTSRGLSGLVWPSRTQSSERGGEGYCVKEGRGREKKRALRLSSPHSRQA